MEKMSCVIIFIFILSDSHLWGKRCIAFHVKVTGENPHTENRRNSTHIYVKPVNSPLKKYNLP